MVGHHHPPLAPKSSQFGSNYPQLSWNGVVFKPMLLCLIHKDIPGNLDFLLDFIQHPLPFPES